MNHPTVIAADIAKNVFQCVQFHQQQQIGRNKQYKRTAFEKLIRTSKPCKLVMETCSGAHHWARLAQSYGHQVMLIPPKVVTPYRQGQKTDANDAMAIYEAAQRHKIKTSPLKTMDQQALSTLERVRTHYQARKTRLSNAIRGHLAEFGLVIPKGYAALRRHLPRILEDAENGVPMPVRAALNLYWQDWQQAHQHVLALEKEKGVLLKQIPYAKELLKIPGIGPVSAAGLVCALGDATAFTRAKEAAAFIGTSPRQHSSGGKTQIVGISKGSGHKQLRASLIQGAWSIILKLKTRKAAMNEQEQWLRQLIERQGENRAAVALANKNVRIAWAILTHKQSYRAA